MSSITNGHWNGDLPERKKTHIGESPVPSIYRNGVTSAEIDTTAAKNPPVAPYQPGTMKAVVWEGKPYNMVVKDIPRPVIRNDRDVIVRVTTAAVCGSDLHTYHGILGGPGVPYAMGHEAVGIVVAIGKDVKEFRIGDRVIVPDGLEINEDTEPGTELGIYGIGTYFGKYLGGCQSEYVKVPAGDEHLYKLPAGFANELDYITISDIFPTAWTGITRSGFQPGDTVAIYGAGPVGLLGAYSALLRGANRVYSVDHVESRLKKAASIGAIPINLRNGDPAEQILKHEPQGVQRACDMVGYECVNTELEPQRDFIINSMLKVVANHGGIEVTGAYWGAKPSPGEPLISEKWKSIPFDVATWWTKNVTITGGLVEPQPVAPALLQLIQSGRATPSFVIESVVSIDQAPEAYAAFSQHLTGKTVIRFFP
ncbi:MAG: hypothetical protein M1820_004317 [Bogoriella megaspora]|nr:MAG: hypothetical protein M1820_004317 [Bogoriella megaspora]